MTDTPFARPFGRYRSRSKPDEEYGEGSEVGQARPRGSGADGDHDHTIDEALGAHALDEVQQLLGTPQGAARDD